MAREFGPGDYDANYYGHEGPSLRSNYNLPYNELRKRRIIRFQLTAAHILHELKLKRTGEVTKILDIGGATGILARFLNHKPWIESCNLDISSWAIQNSLPDVKSIQGDARNLPFPGESFDGVVCLDVLEHIPEKDSLLALTEIARVMKSRRRAVLGIVLEGVQDGDKDLSHITRKSFKWWSEKIKEADLVADNSGSVRLARLASFFPALGGRILTVRQGLFVVSKT